MGILLSLLLEEEEAGVEGRKGRRREKKKKLVIRWERTAWEKDGELWRMQFSYKEKRWKILS